MTCFVSFRGSPLCYSWSWRGTLAPAAGERPIKASGEEGFTDNNFLQGSGEATHLGRVGFYLAYDRDQLENGYCQWQGLLSSANADVLYFYGFYSSFDPATGVASG